MSDTTKRFSDRVDNYIKYRPGYPPEAYNILKNDLNLKSSQIVADMGSGTGISSELFLKHGHKVIGVEPNAEMRHAAEKLLTDYVNFISVDGKAEDTALKSSSVDLILAGQAFHWFDAGKAKNEFKRILKPDGYVVLIWNERISEADEFLVGYDGLLKKYANDYEKVKHRNIDDNIFKSFFNEAGYVMKKMNNSQSFDLEGIKGRLLSSSYTALEGEKLYGKMMSDLQELFEKSKKDDKVIFLYDTKIYYGKI